MKTKLLPFLLALPLCIQGQTQAQSPPPTPPKAESQVPAQPAVALRKAAYKPPVKGAPEVRVAGGARGPSTTSKVLVETVSPNHTGLSATPTPTLFYFQSAPSKARLQITLTEPGVAQPLLDLSANAEKTAGLHGIPLAKHGVTLKPGVTYRWNIALVSGKTATSADPVASGEVRHVAPEAALADTLAKAPSEAERTAILLEAGYFYDGFSALNALADTHPDESSYRTGLKSLLEQVHLTQIVKAAH